MAINYYDEAITQKIKNWLADSSKLKVLSPDDTTRQIQLLAEESGDKPLKLPLITIARNKDIEIESAIKQNKSFDGLIIGKSGSTTIHLNVIPIKTTYQLDIYTKKRVEADEYMRQYLFKLINNPQIIIEIPYNGYLVKHTANIRVLNTVSDSSDIPNHLFSGQFYRWTIQLELQDGFLFSIPQKQGWRIISADLKADTKIYDFNEDNSENINTGSSSTSDNKNNTNTSDKEQSSDNSTELNDWEEILFECTPK
jgi:hypothetical protein